jgi:hypothetical protein
MGKIPYQISTPSSATDVSSEVAKLLRAAGVKDQLPTPKSDILACARLVELGELDLAEYEATLANRALDLFHKAISRVLGLFDRRSEIIYVASDLADSRQVFVTYHEVTHKILRWQGINITEEDESTLSSGCKDLFEAEANYGAADILFQGERFQSEARDYELSIASAQYLAGRYGASYHSGVRRFVERNHRPCLLLVLKPTCREYPDGAKSFFISYSIPSSSFIAEFGDPLNAEFINPHEELGKTLNDGGNGEMSLVDLKGFLRPCAVQSFSNGFRTFALIFPKESRFGRKSVYSAN